MSFVTEKVCNSLIKWKVSFEELCCLWKYFGNACLKGNPNFQGILGWILQILHYYFRKQNKNIENSWIIEQNLTLSLPFSLFTVTCASYRLPQWQSFSFLQHSTSQILNVTSDCSCHIWFHFLVWKWFSAS